MTKDKTDTLKRVQEVTEVTEDAAMTSQADKTAREKDRVNSGRLEKLGRLLLFSPSIPEDEEDNWSIVAMQNLKECPKGVFAGKKMTPFERKQPIPIKYKAGLVWPSCVFMRLEPGTNKCDVERALTKICAFWMDRMKEDKTGAFEAYRETVDAFPDALFAK